jgi:hypothetical protein
MTGVLRAPTWSVAITTFVDCKTLQISSVLHGVAFVDVMTSPGSPPVVPRPTLAGWMFDRDLRPKDAAHELGVGTEQVRRYCLPFQDRLRVIPPQKVLERIVIWTRGAVTARDFYPPHLAGPTARSDDRSPKPISAPWDDLPVRRENMRGRQ